MPLKKNQVYQGDCLKQLRKLETGSVDLVFADPPFNIGYEYDVYDDSQSTQDYLAWCGQWISGVYDALKSNGTFWLAIGDEYAAELKIESQKAGFHCRSWVIWYYTFGVNCKNGFSRSHTHLFHFVKDPKNFTFVRPNPNVRVKSARQLVYADLRANPSGRLPDNTWITRPQDAPEAFRSNHDTWFYSRVAGTFKEREGFHGCQMPEQLLARIIRTSSNPYDLVLDPFGGSGTTLCVAKKLRRNWIGFELSSEYVKHIKQRMANTQPRDALDGPEDPIESAPQTSLGKKRKKKKFDEETIQAVVESYEQAGHGFPSDYLLCDKNLNAQFIRACLKKGIGGNAIVWNRLLLSLRKQGRLPGSVKRPARITAEDLNQFGYASEVAWRLVSEEFRMDDGLPISLDDILCCPDTAEYFDQIAMLYGPQHLDVSSLQYRRAALAIRKRDKDARRLASDKFPNWTTSELSQIRWSEFKTKMPNSDSAGVFLIRSGEARIYAGATNNLVERMSIIENNPNWSRSFELDSILFLANEQGFSENSALKSIVSRSEHPILNIWSNAA